MQRKNHEQHKVPPGQARRFIYRLSSIFTWTHLSQRHFPHAFSPGVLSVQPEESRPRVSHPPAAKAHEKKSKLSEHGRPAPIFVIHIAGCIFSQPEDAFPQVHANVALRRYFVMWRRA